MNDTDESPIEPTKLREALLLAAVTGSHDRLIDLCRAQASVITEHFAEWCQPDGIETQHPVWETRIGGLYTVAKVFANHLNNTELLRLLLDDGLSSEIAEWETRLSAAMQRLRSFQYDEAIAILTNQLIDARTLAGHGHLHLSATTHWYLSQCYWLRQEPQKAIGHGERSLQIAERIHDDRKYVVRYLKHLYEVHRYFGNSTESSQYASQTAELLANSEPETARFFRTQARLLAGPGEPLTRVVIWVGSIRYELDELPIVKDAELKLTIERNRIGLQPAATLVQQGQAARDAGRIDDALDLFRQAHAADPYDPEPLLNQAFVLAFTERYYESIECFEAVEQLAPGWPYCRTGLWFVQRMLAGEFPSYALSMVMSVSRLRAEDPGKLDLSQKAIEQFADLAVFRLEHAQCLSALGKTVEMQSELRRGLECQADTDIRTRLLLELGQVTKGEERASVLQEAVELNGNLVAAAVAKLMLRESN